MRWIMAELALQRVADRRRWRLVRIEPGWEGGRPARWWRWRVAPAMVRRSSLVWSAQLNGVNAAGTNRAPWAVA